MRTWYSKRLLINITRRFKITSDGWVVQNIIMQNIKTDNELPDISSIKLKCAINGKIFISARALYFTYRWILNTIFFSIRKHCETKSSYSLVLWLNLHVYCAWYTICILYGETIFSKKYGDNLYFIFFIFLLILFQSFSYFSWFILRIIITFKYNWKETKRIIRCRIKLKLQESG